jgi:hypothetical protein
MGPSSKMVSPIPVQARNREKDPRGRVGEVCLSGLLLFFSITADARTCLKVDDENSPTVTVSGRVTTQHRVPKGSELRAGDGPWLMLDQPVLADPTGEPGMRNCTDWRKIAIVSDRRAWRVGQ